MQRGGFTRSAALAAALVLGGFAAPSGAVVIGAGMTDADAIALGNNFAYSSVGQIYATGTGGNSFASGVLVASNWVLTVSHLTDDATSLKFFLDSGGTSSSRSGSIAAAEWFTHPGWTGDALAGYDIALIRLSADAPCLGAGTCQIAPIYTGTAELNRISTLVGYGMTGTGATGTTGFDGLKRAGENRVDAVLAGTGIPGSVLIADFDSGLAGDNVTGSATPLAREAMIAPGDSGGGLFATIDGLNMLVGVASFVGAVSPDNNPNSDFGDIGAWTRLSSYVDWIFGTITTADADIAAPVPEPAALALLGLGLLALGGLRRRRS